MLKVDEATKQAFVEVVERLRSARQGAGIYQAELSSRVGVSEKTLSAWENLRHDPTLLCLTRWSCVLDQCLVTTGPDSKILPPDPLLLLPAETIDSFELRRLAGPLKSRREALNLSQKALGQLVGVSGSSISYWELTCISPRSIAQIVWARKLGCSIALWPKELVQRETIRALTGE